MCSVLPTYYIISCSNNVDNKIFVFTLNGNCFKSLRFNCFQCFDDYDNNDFNYRTVFQRTGLKEIKLI